MRAPALAVLVIVLAACSTAGGTASVEPSIATPAPATPSPTIEPTPAMIRLTGTALPHSECWFEVPLYEGTEVRVRDGAGELIALGEVGERLGDGLAMAIDFEVPEAAFYVIEVGAGDTKDQTFSLEEVLDGDVLLVADC